MECDCRISSSSEIHLPESVISVTNTLRLFGRFVIVIGVLTTCSHRYCLAQSSFKKQKAGSLAHHALSSENPMERAGNPLCISPLARYFPGPKYKGYSVGGGAAWYGTRATALRGECRHVNEGTFGVDYAPWYSRIQTRWFHGRKQQGGEGQYEPDGCNNPLDDHLGFGWKYELRKATLKWRSERN